MLGGCRCSDRVQGLVSEPIARLLVCGSLPLLIMESCQFTKTAHEDVVGVIGPARYANNRSLRSPDAIISGRKA